MLKKIFACICVLALIVSIVVFIKALPMLSSVYYSIFAEDGPMPSDGLWYCRELQMQLSFIPNSSEEHETHTYVITEEGCVMCGIWLPIRRTDMSVDAQDFDHMDILGKKLFRGVCVSVDDDCYIIRGDDGVDYQFYRIDRFSATSYLDGHSNQIDALQQSWGEPKHVEIAAEYAIDLWKRQLGLVDSVKWDDLCIAYDQENYYWLITLLSSESVSYYALISETGEFASTWSE